MKVVRKVFVTLLSTLSLEKLRVKLFKQTEKHLPRLRYFVLAVLSLVIILSGCVMWTSRPVLYPFEAPSVSDPANAAHVTIARKERLRCELTRFKLYIELDGLVIAALESGQYTEFFVNSGQHTITATWSVSKAEGCVFILFFDWEWVDIKLTEEFAAGNEYKFLVSLSYLAQRPTIEEVQSFPNNVSLDPSKLVLPGTKQDYKP